MKEYAKGWKEGRKKLIKELKRKNKLLVEGFMEDFKKGLIILEELFNSYATHVELLIKNMEKEVNMEDMTKIQKEFYKKLKKKYTNFKFRW
jgi:hypothetical protein